jgi:peptidoglycan/LPS O-acetylase OafA/YrhL
MIKYRPEIDGLRALAVLPVVFFHAGWSAFSGGYVGVDIFFVISGYLITTLIFAEIDAGAFSLLKFYERRIRRIFPALFVVLAASAIAAPILMSPANLMEFARACFAGVTFVANILAWRQSGYFEPSNIYKPLLHLWSLAVEEQFYIFFPLLLLGMAKLSWGKRLGVIATLMMISFGLAVFLVGYIPAMTFYGLHTRAWELLAGSCCALLLQRFALKPSAPASFLGLLLICAAVVLFDQTITVPSVWTLMPVSGTALIILFTHKGGPLGSLLASRPLVGLGKISYSLYLWHLPLLAFARIHLATAPSTDLLAMLIFLAFVLACLTWAFVEQPFRRSNARRIFNQRGVLVSAACASAVLMMVSLVFWAASGFPNRSNASGQSYASINFDQRFDDNYGLGIECTKGFTLAAVCATTLHPKVLVWGDSFAMHIAQSVADALPAGAGVRQMTMSSCLPVFDLSPDVGEREAGKCISFNMQVDDWLRQNSGITTVVVSSTFGPITDQRWKMMTLDGSRIAGSQDLAQRSIREVIKRFRGYGLRIVIVSPTPHTATDVGHCLQNILWATGNLEGCDFETDKLSDATLRARQLLKQVEGEVPVIWLNSAMCNETLCHAAFGDVALYRDSGHLSVEGAKWLGQNAVFKAALNEAFGK